MLMTMMGFFCGIVDRGITGGGLYPVYFQQVISPQAVNEKRTHIHLWSSLKMYIQLNTKFQLVSLIGLQYKTIFKHYEYCISLSFTRALKNLQTAKLTSNLIWHSQK